MAPSFGRLSNPHLNHMERLIAIALALAWILYLGATDKRGKWGAGVS